MDLPFDESARSAWCHAIRNHLPCPEVFQRSLGAKVSPLLFEAAGHQHKHHEHDIKAVYTFCRFLKRCPELTPQELTETIEWFRLLSTQVMKLISTSSSYVWGDRDTFYGEVCRILKDTKCAHGDNPADTALRQAKARPVTLTASYLDAIGGSEQFRADVCLVASASYHLALYTDPAPFSLSVEQAGAFCGKSEQYAKNHGSGILSKLSELVRHTGNTPSFTMNQAREFAFQFERRDLYSPP